MANWNKNENCIEGETVNLLDETIDSDDDNDDCGTQLRTSVPKKNFKNILKGLTGGCNLNAVRNFNVFKDLTQVSKRKPFIICLVFLILIGIYVKYSLLARQYAEQIPVYHNSAVPGMKGYLVWNEKCKILNIDPYDPDTMKYFIREPYEPCTTEQRLTNLQFDTNSSRYRIQLNVGEQSVDSSSSLKCCYQAIERTIEGENADKLIQLSKCFNFDYSAQIPNAIDNILVKCNSKKKQIYIDGFPMIQERSEIRDRLKAWKMNDTEKPVSILMLGIDTVSRVNLIRAMPKTAQLLYDTEWFEMAGYNKMDDNTFPNLMALLAGFNNSNAFDICKPKIVGGLDKCPLLWKTFRENGYVTSYAEDSAEISTFNYFRLGFEKPPVDYYFRPFLLAAEKYLPVIVKSTLNFCLGYQHSFEYIYEYAFELAKRYKNEPYFGFYWSSAATHNDISDSSSMDVKMLEYVQKLSTSGILNDSVVVFFSDHGMRFGPTLKFLSGHLEERLPFMFIWLPPWLKEKHPEFVAGLKANKNRLTNPYDIHMTLKHLLELSGRVKNLSKALDCPNCQSLLKPVPENRGCDEIGITDHWCTCISFESVSTTSRPIQEIGQYIITYLNEYVSNFTNGSFSHNCSHVELYKILSAHKAQLNAKKCIQNIEEYRIVVQSTGEGIFEATIRRNTDDNKLALTGSISRLNKYATDSKCITEETLKKFCHCENNDDSDDDDDKNIY